MQSTTSEWLGEKWEEETKSREPRGKQKSRILPQKKWQPEVLDQPPTLYQQNKPATALPQEGQKFDEIIGNVEQIFP